MQRWVQYRYANPFPLKTMLNHIILIGLMLLGFLYWYKAQEIKEIAFNATRAHCLAMDVQMLDDYIATDGLSLVRDAAGAIHCRRSFLFEFASTGEKRYNGKIIMLGQRVESIDMEPYRIDLTPQTFSGV